MKYVKAENHGKIQHGYASGYGFPLAMDACTSSAYGQRLVAGFPYEVAIESLVKNRQRNTNLAGTVVCYHPLNLTEEYHAKLTLLLILYNRQSID